MQTSQYKLYIDLSQLKVNDISAKAVQSYSSNMAETGSTGVIGHYTQEVWSKTDEVGCGFIKFRDDSGWIKTVSFIYILSLYILIYILYLDSFINT